MNKGGGGRREAAEGGRRVEANQLSGDRGEAISHGDANPRGLMLARRARLAGSRLPTPCEPFAVVRLPPDVTTRKRAAYSLSHLNTFKPFDFFCSPLALSDLLIQRYPIVYPHFSMYHST
jgi:hypothetical protein